MILFHKLLPELLSPLTVALALLAVGAAWRRRGPLVAALLLLGLASNPLVADRLLRLAEGHAVRLSPADIPPADAIVVLSAGRTRPPGAPVSEWVDANRFFGGLELWQAGRAPRMVFTRAGTEGLAADQTEGDLLAALALALGVPGDALLLTASVVNTADEARETAAVLPPGARVVLVTSAFHMLRAQRQFAATGLTVYPFPVDFRAAPRPGWSVLDVVPSAGALRGTHLAVREWYGRAFYRVFG